MNHFLEESGERDWGKRRDAGRGESNWRVEESVNKWKKTEEERLKVVIF
jgi:hypothetical protein